MSNAGINQRQEKAAGKEALDRERHELLQRLDDWLDAPMLLLAILWLALLVAELIWGENYAVSIAGAIIWGIFIIDFLMEFILAPHKVDYLKGNWLQAISILLPVLRIFSIFRVFRLLRLASATRSLRLLRLFSSLNRGMRALGASLSRRGFSYIMILTILVMGAGAAGMHSFEKESPGGLHSYGEALWWTAMIMTTLGSQYWPQTVEGRFLCIFLALYAIAVFSYVTAAMASFFIGRDAENEEAELVGANQLADLREEVMALRADLRAWTQQPPEMKS